MPRVGFKPTIPATERTKTVHALVHAVTVTDEAELREIRLSFCLPHRMMHDYKINKILLLTFYIPVVTISTTRTIVLKLCILPTECIICMCHMVLIINSDCFLKQD
jgi:hypothetical protein